MPVKPIRIVSATRASADEAPVHTLLGRCLASLQWDAEVRCSFACDNDGENAFGLGEVYNRFLTPKHAREIVAFVHDDVAIDDYFIRQRLNEAMKQFDVVGVAGNMQAESDDVSWAFEFRGRDEERLYPIAHNRFSGAVAHLQEDAQRVVSHFGPTPMPCQRLDGCFIAVNVARILDAGVRFDEQFRFHAYDVDFSRAAVEAGLRVGTWPIAITHGSEGNFHSDSWREAALRYRAKWSERRGSD